MNIYNIIIFIISCSASVAYACRLGMLKHGLHNESIILMHKAMSCSVVFAGADAWMGQASIGDFSFLIASVAWIAVSSKTWAHGVPSHFHKNAINS